MQNRLDRRKDVSAYFMLLQGTNQTETRMHWQTVFNILHGTISAKIRKGYKKKPEGEGGWQ